MDFAVPADDKAKLIASEKRDKYLDLARELKNLEHEGDGMITPKASFLKPNYSWPVIRPVVRDQGHYTFLYRYAKHNREGGRKE